MTGRGLGRRAQISIHSKAWLWRPPHAYSTLGPSCRMVLSRIIHYNLLQCVSIDGVHVSGMSTVKLSDPPRRFQHFAGWDCAQLCFDDDLEEVHFTASVSKQPFLLSLDVVVTSAAPANNQLGAFPFPLELQRAPTSPR